MQINALFFSYQSFYYQEKAEKEVCIVEVKAKQRYIFDIFNLKNYKTLSINLIYKTNLISHQMESKQHQGDKPNDQNEEIKWGSYSERQTANQINLNQSINQTIKPVILHGKVRRLTQIAILLALMTLVIALSLFSSEIFGYLQQPIGTQKDVYNQFSTKLQKIDLPTEDDKNLVIQSNSLLALIHRCPEIQYTFHIYYNQTDDQMIGLQAKLKKMAEGCLVPILGFKDLKELISKWNLKYPNLSIQLSSISSNQNKQKLLIFLQLYFNAGTYIDIKVNYQSVENRCWKYAYTALYEILFVEIKEIDSNGLYIPNPEKFMKVRLPQSPQVKTVIEKIIQKEDFLFECRQRQCLIVKCIQ